ncbi:MAG: peptidoglycan DD-metalloendopeptidase family protein, partial [Candidatus Eiseniibacteriota bacterium]
GVGPLVPPAAASTADEIRSRTEELERIRQELEAARREARDLGGRESAVVAELGSIDKQATVLERFLRTLEAQEQALARRLTELALEINALQADLDASRDRLGARVREMYKRGRPNLLEVAFASASLPDLFRQVDMMMRLADEEKRLMGEIAASREELVAARQEVERRRLDVQQVRTEKDAERRRLGALERERRDHLERIRTERRARESAVAELAAAETELTEVIRRLEERRRAAGAFIPVRGPFADNRGLLPWPVRGKLKGVPGVTRPDKRPLFTRNNGIDIGAAAGTPFRVVADGRVILKDWLNGYGYSVIVDHGDGYYTFYAHAASIQVEMGQTLRSGDVIGTVGQTGSLKGTMLHFEIRQGAEAVDPRSWLVD